MHKRTQFQYLLRWLVPVAMVWVLAGCFLLAQLWPDLPQTRKQWALLLVFGPPLYVIGEAGSAWLVARTHNSSGKRFSLARIAFMLPVAAVWFALCWLFASLIGSQS